MCIIIHLPAGQTVPEKTLENCYDQNPNGWGIMAAKDGHIESVKGVNGFKKFLKAWKKIPTDAERAVHFRIKTHGEINYANCHPFSPMENVFMMHNGVIDTVLVENKMSDTFNYCEYELKPIMKVWPNWEQDPVFADIVKEGVGYSRVLFMNAKGKVLKINSSMWVERDGCSFSHSIPYYSSYNNNYYNRNNYGTGHQDHDYSSESIYGSRNTGQSYGLSWKDKEPKTYLPLKEVSDIKSDLYSGNKTDEEGQNMEDQTIEERARMFNNEEFLAEIQKSISVSSLKEEDYEEEDDEVIFIPEIVDLITMSKDQLIEFVQDYPRSAAQLIEDMLGQGINNGIYEIPSDYASDENNTTKEVVTG